jgi:ligand-binding sensor domain-containing protein
VRVRPGETAKVAFQVAAPIQGQWRRYSSALGLRSSRVYDLDFAPDGALWLATANGFSRFDGRQFSNYHDQHGLLNNSVFSIHVSTTGAIWLGTGAGLSRYDPATGGFENFRSGERGLATGRVLDLTETGDGAIWARTEHGLSRFVAGEFQSYPGIPRLGANFQRTFASRRIESDGSNGVWISSEGGLLRQRPGEGLMRQTADSDLTFSGAAPLALSPKGQPWFVDQSRSPGVLIQATDNGFKRTLVGNLLLDLPNNVVSALHVTADGGIWSGDILGRVTWYDPKRGEVYRFGADEAETPAQSVWQIKSGPDGAVWFATGSGV